MLIFLFGTWGAGKSYIGNMIEEKCGMPHMEGDLHFTEEMLQAINTRTFHELNLDDYYNKVIQEMRSYQKRTSSFVVNQGVYQEKYRQMIYDRFAPDIVFFLIHTPNKWVRNKRLRERMRQGNPVTPKAWEYMAHHWEIPKIPFEVILNNKKMETTLVNKLKEYGLCEYWGQG